MHASNCGQPEWPHDRMYQWLLSTDFKLVQFTCLAITTKFGKQMQNNKGHVTYFWNFGTPFKFATHIDHDKGALNVKNAKLGQRGREGACVLLFKFWDTLHIWGTVEARNFKHFHKSVQIDYSDLLLVNVIKPLIINRLTALSFTVVYKPSLWNSKTENFVTVLYNESHRKLLHLYQRNGWYKCAYDGDNDKLSNKSRNLLQPKRQKHVLVQICKLTNFT